MSSRSTRFRARPPAPLLVGCSDDEGRCEVVREATRDPVYEKAYEAVHRLVLHHGTRVDMAALHVLDYAAREGLLEEGVEDAEEDGEAS